MQGARRIARRPSRAPRHVAVVPGREKEPDIAPRTLPRPSSRLYPLLVAAAFLIGLLISYAAWAGDATTPEAVDVDEPSNTAWDLEQLRQQVNPPGGHQLKARYGDLGPRLLAAGVIDYDAFVALNDRSGQPLTADQMDVLLRASDRQVVVSRENALFLLDFFWAVGLANRNPILTDGPMAQYSNGNIEGFASTGGWSLAASPVTELYASMDLIQLSPAQQARVEEVASAVYRPCCDNPTLFPDCNHGMAMLGLLELMASQGATTDEMFAAASYLNAYWFPGQALETAFYLKEKQGIDYAGADPRLLTGVGLASGSSFASIHEDLQASGLLPQDSGGAGSCAS